MGNPDDQNRPGCSRRPLRIVVVDEDPGMCQFYQEALARLGHQVCVAPSWQQAAEQVQALGPDLLLLSGSGRPTPTPAPAIPPGGVTRSP
jgi:PleD family two-component response regulator